ncbi:uncharacterized protein J4E78_002817 [Alternaria triticimaculans]|uniref:uncharacterized protein n=1 Tax=Alternaria triticimaculans TaxID=297637 RepID=UPI0020C53F0E|nr:uncharacterized protein J4E78_002817 [Alternaria triticimaculans]KAI4665357.1 hypothetical protein J4E78_002817 [Alternaria triticimaculans]
MLWLLPRKEYSKTTVIMDEKKCDPNFKNQVEYVITDKKLGVFTSTEYQPWCKDIIYLLDVGRKHLRHYTWEGTQNDKDAELHSGATTLVDGGDSNDSLDSMKQSFDFPTQFNASTVEGQKSIAITIKWELEPESWIPGAVRWEGHVARFLVGDWTLAKGQSVVSEREAMIALFYRVHRLAESYREMDEEKRKKDEAERAKDEERRIAREKEAGEAVVE